MLKNESKNIKAEIENYKSSMVDRKHKRKTELLIKIGSLYFETEIFN